MPRSMEQIYTGFMFAVYWFITLVAGITLVIISTYAFRWIFRSRVKPAETREEPVSREVKVLDEQVERVAAIAAVTAYMERPRTEIPPEESQPQPSWKLASILYSSSHVEEVK